MTFEYLLIVNIFLGCLMTPWLFMSYLGNNPDLDTVHIIGLGVLAVLIGSLVTPIGYIVYKLIEFLESKGVM